ncbi:protein SRC2-like [Curcuma longa]|uniref:protein SRC2-like n=1 Tax=Curcuma longa TaxID=136217 RepID=UPI003D9E0430
MAAYRTLEVKLISAKELKNVNVFGKMDVYAVVSIVGLPWSPRRTHTDKKGGKKPSWNATLRFVVPVDPAASASLVLHVALRSEGFLGDRKIGYVQIPVKELLAKGGDKDSTHFGSYRVRRPNSGKPKGVINLSYKFLDPPGEAGSSASASPPPGAYPANGARTQYTPCSAGYGYPPPSQHGYALQYGHGAAGPLHNSNFGGGLGADLDLGGATGGFLLAYMATNAAAHGACLDPGVSC